MAIHTSGKRAQKSQAAIRPTRRKGRIIGASEQAGDDD
jgi:hypothetical protein